MDVVAMNLRRKTVHPVSNFVPKEKRMKVSESLVALVILIESKHYDRDEIRHAVAVWLLAHYTLDEIRDAVIGFEE